MSVRRHTLFLSDREIALVERALLCYATVVRIQTGSERKVDADQTAHVSAIVQQHYSCDCPSPNLSGALRPIALDNRKVT